MARDSGGTYTAPANSVNPAVEGEVIDENDFNELVTDVVAALTDSLDRTGKGKITAHIDFDENGSPGTPAANVGRLYVADVGGVTTLKFKDNAGTDYNLLLTSPGLAYAFETTADTTTNPGSGNIRFDNASISSTTEIAVSDTDSNGSDLSAFIASWDDSTSLAARGRLIIQNRTAPANVAIFTINGASTDESGWTRLAVAYVTHNGSFGAAAPLGVTFSPAGNAGLDGVSAGLLYNFATSTTTTSDPGAGNLRLDNASLSSVTEIALADTSSNSGNPDVSAFVLTWDDSTSSVRGTVTLKKATALANFATYSISGASTDEAGWVRLAVTHVDSSGSFSANDPIGVEFVRTGDKGDTGNTGLTGAPGADGTDPGIRWTFDDSTTTNADPGSGDLRLNNASLASVTELAISYSSGETSNPSVEEWVKAWDDSTTTGNRGTLIIKKPSAPQNFAVYSITSAITDGTTYGRFTLSHIVSAGSFAASDVLSVQFARTGDKGADGAGVGDVVGPASSVDGEIALFDSTTGKALKRATTTGLLKASSGVIAAAVSGTDYVAPGGALGTPSGGTLTNATGLPVASGISGLGTGVATALAVNVGSAGAPVVNGGALGTPSSGTLTNCTGLPLSGVVDSTSEALGVGTLELGHASDTTLARSAAGEVTIEGVVIKKAGKETIGMPAGAMTPRTTNGAATGTTELATNDVMLSTLDFDTTTEEGAGFWVPMPKSWNESTVTFQAAWTAASGSGGVAWGLAAYSFSDDDAMDTAVSGQQVVTDTLITANDLHLTAESSAITIGGTPTQGDWVYFEITREVADGSDTLGVDAKLLGIRLFFTTNASTDA